MESYRPILNAINSLSSVFDWRVLLTGGLAVSAVVEYYMQEQILRGERDGYLV